MILRNNFLRAGGCLAILTALVIGCQRSATQSDQPPAAIAMLTPADIQLHDRGVGLMGQFNYTGAHDEFARLVERHPHWPDVKIDLAIAKLNRREADDVVGAEQLLEEVIQSHPEQLRAKYCRAILLLYQAEPDRALSLFRDVAESDPSDAYAIYYAGQCLLEKREYESALEYFQRAQIADPYLRSAYYGAFQAEQRLSRPDAAKQSLQLFQKLADNPQARSAEIKYSRMGPKAEVQTTGGSESDVALPPGPLFVEAESLDDLDAGALPWAAWADADRLASATACDINGDGQVDLFLAGALAGPDGARWNALVLRDGQAWKLALDHPLSNITAVNAALWGDFDNDTLTDVYLCRDGVNRLWRQVAANDWQDVTASTQTGAGDLDTVDGAMFDADHDGDLDLLLLQRNGQNELLNNNLDGTFRPIAEEQGIAGDGRSSRGVVISDLDGDRDADLVVLHDDPPHAVYLNDRLWNYSAGVGFERLCATAVYSAVATDVDADGRVEIITSSPDGWRKWQRDDGGVWVGARLDIGDLQPAAGPLAVQDLDGDGRLDLVGATTQGWIVAHVLGDNPKVLYSAPSTPAETGSWALAVTEPGRGWSVVAPVSAKAPRIWNPGSGRHSFADLQFSGKENKADQMRSNASGIGIRAAARVGGNWTSLQTFRFQSGVGQSRQPIPVGLCGRRTIDFVSLLWPDGLFQTELSLMAGTPHHIEETQRQVSSCPVLFVWDGREHRFVSDVLGVGGLGFNHGRGVYHAPRPWENLMLPADLPVATDAGTYRLKIGEPMEEACYLDAVRLVAYDLPAGWRMTLDERQAVGAPAATGRPIYYRQTFRPTVVVNQRGEDISSRLMDADGHPAPIGTKDPRFLARTDEFSVAMKFSCDLTQLAGRPVLVIDGWVEYPYSQTMFAAWQAGANYDTPKLEARAEGGSWVVVYPDFGYPAGMPRQMSLPLDPGRLPEGASELRIRTNMEVYWDRMFLAVEENAAMVRKTELPLAAAVVQEVGFPLRTNTAARMPSFDYARRAPLWDTRHQPGFYTNFGDASPLLADVDDAVAIIGPGEEVEFEFVAALGATVKGWTRQFVLECHGWCKDMDLYTEHGERLEPLPRRDGVEADEARRTELLDRFNRRFRAGS